MTTEQHPSDQKAVPAPAGERQGQAHGGHGWMMIACCVPMLAIALALVVTGVVGVGFLLVALACTAMMALMMRGMSGGDSGDGSGTGHRHG